MMNIELNKLDLIISNDILVNDKMFTVGEVFEILNNKGISVEIEYIENIIENLVDNGLVADYGGMYEVSTLLKN